MQLPMSRSGGGGGGGGGGFPVNSWLGSAARFSKS